MITRNAEEQNPASDVRHDRDNGQSNAEAGEKNRATEQGDTAGTANKLALSARIIRVFCKIHLFSEIKELARAAFIYPENLPEFLIAHDRQPRHD